MSDAQAETVLITGASRGIGRATALELAAQGYAIVVHYVQDEAAAAGTAGQISAAGAICRLLKFDVADREATRSALQKDMEAHGAYFGVVCNAGIHRDNAFPLLSGEDWDAVLRTNLDGI